MPAPPIFTSGPALLVEQPLATLLAAGVRRLLTLPRYTGHRGAVFIYASAYPTDPDAVLTRYPALAAGLDQRGVARLPVAHVVGLARLVHVSRVLSAADASLEQPARRIYPPRDLARVPLELLATNYSPGRFVVELADAWLLPSPVAYTRPASAELFTLPDDVLAAIKTQLDNAKRDNAPGVVR